MIEIEKLAKQSRNVKLLYVEDNQATRESISLILEEFFEYIIIAVDGEEGLEKFKNNHVDLIITDINMPHLNGLEMIEKIRERDKDIAILIFSAYTESNYFVSSIKLGVDGYLLKPFDLEQFTGALANVIGKIQFKDEVIKNMFLKKRMNLALERSGTSVLDWCFDENSFYISPNWKEMLGYTDDELPNSVLTWKRLVYRDDKKAVFALLKKTFSEGITHFEMNHRLKHKDGHWVWVLGSAQILYDENGKRVRMVGTHTNITEEKELQLKYSQQAQIFEQVHGCIALTDLEGTITSWNRGSELLLGYTADEVIGQSIRIIYPEEDYMLLEQNVALLMKNGKNNIIVRFQKKSKEIIFADLSLSLLLDEEKKPIGVIGYSQDTTKRKQAENILKEEHSYLQTIIDGIQDPIMVIKDDYRVELMNESSRKKSNFDLMADPENPKCYELYYHRSTPCDGLHHPCPLREVIESRKHVTVVHTHKDLRGDARQVELVAAPLFDEHGNCTGIIESARDITAHLLVQDELREQKKTLTHLAHYDTLTSLPNRLLFIDRLSQCIERAKRDQKVFALFFIDLDRFKQINDSLGHKIGDEVLKVVAVRLGSIIRKVDTLARLGGDEFTILIENLTEVNDMEVLAQKILDSLAQVIEIDKYSLYVTASIGISFYPQDDTNADNLLKYADAAMYKAKELGKNNFQFYSADMTAMAMEHIVMAASLHQALDEEEFLVYYQPQINGESGSLIGVEALVRWQHPRMGLLSADQFINIAEKTGLMVSIDQWVMKTAMKQIVQWYGDGLDPGVLAINIAIDQFEEAGFPERLDGTMREIGMKPEWLELELLEKQLMASSGETVEILEQISEMGIKLAIDDFGAGYSTLSYLRNLPVDKLKIHKVFVQNLSHSKEDAAIVKAVIGLSKNLNLKVIAEGVETQAQKEFLTENGCSEMQGYLYGKPISANAMESMLKKMSGENRDA